MTFESNFSWWSGKDHVRQALKPLIRRIVNKYLFELNTPKLHRRMEKDLHDIFQTNDVTRGKKIHVQVAGYVNDLAVEVRYKHGQYESWVRALVTPENVRQ